MPKQLDTDLTKYPSFEWGGEIYHICGALPDLREVSGKVIQYLIAVHEADWTIAIFEEAPSYSTAPVYAYVRSNYDEGKLLDNTAWFKHLLTYPETRLMKCSDFKMARPGEVESYITRWADAGWCLSVTELRDMIYACIPSRLAIGARERLFQSIMRIEQGGFGSIKHPPEADLEVTELVTQLMTDTPQVVLERKWSPIAIETALLKLAAILRSAKLLRTPGRYEETCNAIIAANDVISQLKLLSSIDTATIS